MDRHKYFCRFYDFPIEAYEQLKAKMYLRSCIKGETLVQPGQIQQEIYFVTAGVQMSVYEEENKLHVMAFTYAPEVCVLPDSFALQVPSKYRLICLTESAFECMRLSDVHSLFDGSREIERLFRKMTERILAGTIDRHLELKTTTIEERFKAFCNRSGHLLQLVPHKYLASYLNIDRTNFSKLFNTVKI